MEIQVNKERFKELKDMENYDFNTHLRYKLKSLLLDLESGSEDALKEKIKEVKERMTKMIEELTELREFYEKAKEDKENMEKWIDLLDEENARLLEALKNGRNSD